MVLKTVRNFGEVRDAVEIPDLVAIQKRSYGCFLQKDVAPARRACIGLEALFREIFPIESYDKTMYLEYLYYELEKPRYTPTKCRQLRLTYGYPLKICCRLRTKDGEDLSEQTIYLGEMPVMIGGGEFIINGAERVIVSQLHRSPGVDFLIESKKGDRVLHGGRIIPERGSWIEIGVTSKDVLVVKIDQSSKIPATIFLRAMRPDYGTTEQILRLFYPTKTVPKTKVTPTMWAVGPIVDKESGEIIVKAGEQISDKVSLVQQTKIKDKEETHKVSNTIELNGIQFQQVCTISPKEPRRPLPDKKPREQWHKWGEGPFCKFSIPKKLYKDKAGVYVLVVGGHLAYIGECDDLDNRFNTQYGSIQAANRREQSTNCRINTSILEADKKGAPVELYFTVLGGSKSEREKIEKDLIKKQELENPSFPPWNLEHTGKKEPRPYTEGERILLYRKSGAKVEVIEQVRDVVILNTLAEDDCRSHEEALLKFYMRLRPGNPPNPEKAKTFFVEKFFDPNRYRLGKVGRFRLNRKFGLKERDSESRKKEIQTTLNELKKNLREDNFEKWLKSEEGCAWVEENQESLRKKYVVKGGERTRGFAFSYVVTEEDGQRLKDRKPERELSALEAKVAWEYPDEERGSQLPRFNGKKGMTSKDVNRLWKQNPKLQSFFEQCKEKIESHEHRKGWIPIKSLALDIEKAKVPDKQGIYIFRSLDSSSWEDGVKRGYVGKATNLKQRLEFHLGRHLGKFKAAKPKDLGDNLLHTWAKEEKKKLAREEISQLEEELRRLENPDDEMTLQSEDFLNTMKYIVGLRNNEGTIDDIDHLGNRRLRTIDELAAGEIRKGLLKLRKTVQERMSMKRDIDESVRIADLVNSKSVSSSINYFFGRGELSQVVDQTNALSQLTHERRLSALGPGGLNRRRAGFEVRDVHISHYGRICPIETPEGTNIGLISSLAVFAAVDEYGFLLTPYRKVKNGKVADDVDYLRADEEMKAILAPPSTVDHRTGKIVEGMALARKGGELAQVSSEAIDYIDISPKQIVGISAALIPFLEHDDANRALMGSNMQRQAVPLLETEGPLVGTGMERVVGRNSSMVVRAQRGGVVTAVDGTSIVINQTDEYKLSKFVGLNERTCLNQVPIVKLGEMVEKGQIIADGGGTANGVLALGKNVLVGFVSFDGFNFEDAIIISEKLVKNDSFTSIHIDEFTAEVRETRLGKEEFTCDIPNVSEKALRNLDEYGIIREGTRVCSSDILVGKVVPKSKTELTSEEKLLHAIFGRAGEDVKNDSLELPSGYEGVVIRTERFTRRGAGGEEQRKAIGAQVKQYEKQMMAKECLIFRQMVEAIHKKFEVNIVDPSTRQKVGVSTDDEVIYEQIENFDIKWVRPASVREDVQKIVDKFMGKIAEIKEEKNRGVESLKHGDELPSGVLQMVKVYVATKRTLSIGDKMAGRHGNKGVIAKIMPEEDMPFLEDGTHLDILLNPLGVPSRMNIGQIFETHLGWVAKVLGFNAITPVFDGATEDDIYKLTAEANELMRQRATKLEEDGQIPPDNEFFIDIPKTLKTQLYDGRTGEPFDQKATIGYIYMMKLHHLVDDKIHARATGPYSLITQQPLGGKARTGGQRFGEMEVWALEGYGAAYTLQEMLTVKSDDVEGRTKIYESMVKGRNILEAGTPLSFDVLCNEIRGLGLNIQLEKKRLGSTAL